MPEEIDFMKGLDEELERDQPIVPKIQQEDKNKPDEPTKNNEEEEEEEEDKNEPNFTRNPNAKKSKKTPDESFSELRKSRDEARNRLKTFEETLGDNDPTVLRPIMDLITERIEGPITSESITEILEEWRSSEETITELRMKLEEEEKRVARIDITHSKEFAEKYQKPYKEATDTLFLDYANIGEDGKIIAPKATKALHDFITGNIDKVDAASVKLEIQKFAKAYKAEAGEDPVIPTATQVMGSIRSLRSAKEKMEIAYNNWHNQKKEEETRSLAEKEQEREFIQKKTKRERNTLATKAYRDFDFDSYDFVDEKEVGELFREEFREGEKIFAGEKVPPYDAMLTRGVKARLWDKFGPRLKELMELEKKDKTEHVRGNEIPRNSTQQEKNGFSKEIDSML